MDKDDIIIIERIRAAMEGHVPVYPEGRMPETSAVLIPLVLSDGIWNVVYEQRSSRLKSQPGEICFPGGRCEKGETNEETAVRETCEELLTDRKQVRIIGAMDGVMGPSGAPVWPFVGILENYDGRWSEDEVDHVLYIPLTWLLEHKPKTYTTKLITVPGDDFPYHLIPGGRNYHWREKKNTVYFYETPEAVIWGLTGHISASFAKKCLQS